MPLTLAPREDSSTGIAAPMAMPMIRGKAMEKVTTPVAARACKIPTAAEALCSTQVKSSPTRIPRTGLEKAVSRRRKDSLSCKGATASLMADMPNISTAKPMRMLPTWTWLCFLAAMRRMMPTTATIPVRVEVDSRDTQPEPPSRAERHIIQPVTLVPKMAPRMMPMAWLTFITPEFTKPTTITEVAEEDWMMAVTPVPSKTPFTGLPESL